MKYLIIAILLLIKSLELSAEIPNNWIYAGDRRNDYLMRTNSIERRSGKHRLFIKSTAHEINGFGTISQHINAKKYKGQRLQLTAWMKSENITGWGGIWMRIDGTYGKLLDFDNMHDRAVQGTTDWKKYTIVLNLPKKSINIAFGLLLNGKGTLWGDDFEFTPLGNTYELFLDDISANNTNIKTRREAFQKLYRFGTSKKNIKIFMDLLSSTNYWIRYNALNILRMQTKKNFGFNLDEDLKTNASSIKEWRNWWKANKNNFKLIEIEEYYAYPPIYFEMKNGQATITENLHHSNAKWEGLKPGDIIYEIDGKPTKGKLGIEIAGYELHGSENTAVKIKAKDQETGENKEVELIRKRTH